MPVLIIVPQAGMPAVIEEKTDVEILAALAAPELDYVPAEARKSVEGLKVWIQTLEPPSGWFETTEEAAACQARVGQERDAQLLQAVLDETGMTHKALAAALGLSDPTKDGSPVRKILRAKNRMSGPTRRALAYMLQHGPMTSEVEKQTLREVKSGWWRQVTRSMLRRA